MSETKVKVSVQKTIQEHQFEPVVFHVAYEKVVDEKDVVEVTDQLYVDCEEALNGFINDRNLTWEKNK